MESCCVLGDRWGDYGDMGLTAVNSVVVSCFAIVILSILGSLFKVRFPC